VLLLKDEREPQDNQWVPENLQPGGRGKAEAAAEPMAVTINGVPKTLHAFKTQRNQAEGKTRCYFVSLDGETKPGQANQVTLTLPIRTGLIFSGAYLDLPDQMPLGETPGE
jgi:hypothetical protein